MLTFLAPAPRCNQRCLNCYITDVADEPVRSFELSPGDYARFVDQFLEAEIPILSIKFQGYEVTLPQSWPYLEAVFRRAQQNDIRRGFVTNGMLLHKWADRIRALDVARLSVSLDGASPEVNDRFRGLTGAFDAATKSIKRFLEAAPEYKSRVAIASLIRGEEGFRSLLEMPRVLTRLGISHWIVSFELGIINGQIAPLETKETLMAWLEALRVVATREGVRFHASDEYRALPRDNTKPLKIYTVPTPHLFYRMYPTGHVQTGREVFEPWDHDQIPQWNPRRDNAVETVRYWRAAERDRRAVASPAVPK